MTVDRQTKFIRGSNSNANNTERLKVSDSWNSEEIQFLLDTSSEVNYEELAKHLNRPYYAVKTAARTAFIQKNFGKLSFDEMSDKLKISNKALKKLTRSVFPLDSRPYLFQRLLIQTIDNLSFKRMKEDTLNLVKKRVLMLGKIYSANQQFKRLWLENYSIMCLVVIAEAYSHITEKETLPFVRTKLRKKVKIRRYSLRSLLKKDLGKEKNSIFCVKRRMF